MDQFIQYHVSSALGSLRLLETITASQSDLHTDIKSLRESLSDFVEPASGDALRLPLAYQNNCSDRFMFANRVVGFLEFTIDILGEEYDDPEINRLKQGWIPQAFKVLTRVSTHISVQARLAVTQRVAGLYVIVDPEAILDRDIVDVADSALKGGATVLQLRDKNRDKGEILTLARDLASLCRSYGALFIMNDQADVALSSGSDGLHVGQSDLPVNEARKTLSDVQIIGRSNNGVDESLESLGQGADYLAVGAIFRTSTMGKGSRNAVGPEMITRVKERVDKPVVAIGGITADNIVDVVRAGADSVCVVSAITLAEDPYSATAHLAELMRV